MQRWLMVCAGFLLVGAACDRAEPMVDERRVGIYGAVFGAIYDEELGDPPWHVFEQVVLNDSICGVSREFPGHVEVGEVIVAGYGDEVTCLDSFSPGEQAALLATLPDLPDARFTSEPEEMQQPRSRSGRPGTARGGRDASRWDRPAREPSRGGVCRRRRRARSAQRARRSPWSCRCQVLPGDDPDPPSRSAACRPKRRLSQ